MSESEHPPIVVVALPFAYQDGMDKYNGIMRYLREAAADWELRIYRELNVIGSMGRMFDEDVAGVIYGSAGCVEGNCSDASHLKVCLDFCQSRKIPLVGLDWPLSELDTRKVRRASFFNIDSERIGVIAAQAVIKAGEYSSYGFVGMHPDCRWSRDRGAFFARELRRNGRRNISIFNDDPAICGQELLKWLKSRQKPSAIFAANDCAADVVLKTCLRNGIRVPEDMSVLGVDDDPVFCVHTRPTLTSVHPDFEEMGYLAARELAHLMSGKSKGCRRVVAGEPVITSRMSTAPCSPAGRLARRIDEIIAARACQDLDSDVIADELKISRRLLDLRYRQFNGMSVREAIVNARLKRAKHLLAYSGHSIGTICRMCGYRTESYLGKVFLRKEGVSMGEFRERNRAEGNSILDNAVRYLQH